jgi:DNA-binding transcriptional regulator YdaS (Cro superfamily)
MRKRLRRAYIRSRTLAADAWFDSRLVARLTRKAHVLALGDSHVNVMRHVRRDDASFRVLMIEGATASGITNPNSKTNASNIYRERVQRAKPWQHVLVQLGEVDCGFVIWHRAQRHGIGIEEQLEQTLDNYEQILTFTRDRGFASVMVMAVPLPTITDYPSMWAEIANLRKEVTATQQERTELTIRFNEHLRERCARLGLVFVDSASDQLDPATQLVKASLLRPDDRDHHLADAPYAALIERTLPALG